MRLSSRTFAQDRTFPLVAFDILARSRLQTSIHIRVRSRTNLLGQVMGLTPERVRTWFAHCEDREEAGRKGLRLPPPPPSIGHVALLSSDTLLPAGTPEALNRELLSAQLPDPTKLAQLAGENPFLAAEYYLFVIRTFLSCVLGWDAAAGRSNPAGGIVGHVEDCFCSTESQKSFNLQGHWLEESPHHGLVP